MTGKTESEFSPRLTRSFGVKVTYETISIPDSLRNGPCETLHRFLRHAAYPIFAGAPQTKNLINIHPEKEWGRVVVCRYPSRRAFLKLLSDPSYAPMEPYKFIALEIDLVPVWGYRLIPDLRLIFGGSLLVLFLAVNWLRAAQRRQH